MSRILQALILVSAFSLAGEDRAAAQAPRPKKMAKAKAEKLFNGKDLSGWVWVPAKGKEDSKLADVWGVVDGNLHSKGTPAGYIRTEKDYTSYLLKLQVRHLKPGNGGVLLRVQAPDKVWPKSIEAQGQAGALG